MVYNGFRVRLSTRVSLPFLLVLTGCASTVLRVPTEWQTVPEAAVISAEQLGRTVADATPLATAPDAPAVPQGIRIVREEAGARIYRDTTALTPGYLDIESFDVSADRGEVAFSAKRESNYDVALVHVEGSPVVWIPEDPADEVMPKWASRGHKAAFILRNRGGDLMRTVHIPTAVQLLVNFPHGRVINFEWDRPAERFAVLWESPAASHRVEVMKYGGEDRRTAIPPAVTLPVAVNPFGSGLMLSPEAMTYGDRLPLVIWIAPGERNAWDDARAALLQSVRSAALIVESAPDAALLQQIRETRWIDASKIYLVDPNGAPSPIEGIISIVADASLQPATYERNGSVIGVHPAVVKSFAARFIADQLKESSGHR